MVGGLGFLFTLECMHAVTKYFNTNNCGAKKSAHCSWVLVTELVVRGNQCTSHSIAIPLYNLFDWKGQVPQTIYSTSPDCCQKLFFAKQMSKWSYNWHITTHHAIDLYLFLWKIVVLSLIIYHLRIPQRSPAGCIRGPEIKLNNCGHRTKLIVD